MGLRTIFVVAIILIGLRYALRGPFYCLLFYIWLAYFRPEQWLWSNWISSLNLSFIFGVVVLAASVASRERFRLSTGSFLLFVFLGHSLTSALLSPVSDLAFVAWQEFAKTIVIAYMLTVLLNTEQRLRTTLLVMAMSLSFEAAKQGFAHAVLHPGGANTNDLPMLGDNNGVAVGMLMTLQILIALARTATSRLERYMERFLALGVLLRGIFTYSRGGFLAAVASGLHYALRSKHKIAAGLAIFIVAAGLLQVLPAEFWERMQSIQTAADNPDAADSSVTARRHFWEVAVVMSGDYPFFGVGHRAYNAMYDRYDSSRGAYGRGRSVHSIWFGVLAELGYVGLALYMLLLARALYVSWWAGRLARRYPELSNLAVYAAAIESGLVAFAIGGAFVPLQYVEIFWHFLALSVVIETLVKERVAQLVSVDRPVSFGDGREPVSAAALAPEGRVPLPTFGSGFSRPLG